MASIIKKVLLEFKNNFMDEKKIIMIAKEDRADRVKHIHYVCNVRGSKRSKKNQIAKEEYLLLKQKATSVSVLE